MDAKDLNTISELMRNARATRQPVVAPSKTYPNLDVKSAFEIAKISAESDVKNGDRIVGYKLGNIAKVMQDYFGVDEPDYGFLLASRFEYEGTKIPLSNYIEPFVELEPAFVLKGKLKGPNVTVADVINAIDYALPAIEIIDSRVQNWTISLEDTLADNGSNGAVILGGPPKRITDLNLSNMRGYLEFNGKEIMDGNTRNILGNPLAAVAWLVNRLAEFDIEFQPGQVILPGSCLRAMPAKEPGHWSCTYEGWGTIEFDLA
ncbi:unnamed protein product [Clonostachys chloroleuca]|uniref:2-hydroxypenta-2,4-dienoate hydratase n=1 Tax=Clonostachys chloroleuca TaxID=1926264 RepID=A0AA35LRC9_9HYPO|nr:unnamed protein product [Clonostachys chloroleuca]